MWQCIRCGIRVKADQAPPDVDDFGLHFICPECGRRNPLVSHGEHDGMLVLEQPNKDL